MLANPREITREGIPQAHVSYLFARTFGPLLGRRHLAAIPGHRGEDRTSDNSKVYQIIGVSFLFALRIDAHMLYH
jgi:hypothetical protein